jgi:hypothetical protein
LTKSTSLSQWGEALTSKPTVRAQKSIIQSKSIIYFMMVGI